ncbi:MAG: DNA alkylation repair protein [Rhodothermales bacterium]
MATVDTLVTAVRDALAAAGNADYGLVMQDYMKSALPFHGVRSPERKAICKPLFDAHRLRDQTAWLDGVEALWHEAEYREERYAALGLARHRYYRAYRTPEVLPLYESLIVTGAWWDLVDETASHLVGPLLKQHTALLTPVMERWATDPNLWKRRTAIISQLRFKDRTDWSLLQTCIAPNMDDPDFFIRKAIGWALRTYSRVEPDQVLAYVVAHDHLLSPLSKREALRLIT